MLDHLICDCDGVLVDSEIIAARVEAELLTQAGYEITAEELSELYAGLTFKDIMLRIEDKALADRMREFIACHVPASLEVTPEVHAARKTLLTRLRWLASWFLVSVLDYTVSRRLNLGLG